MNSLRILRVAGIDVRLHPTFILIVLLEAWRWSTYGARGAAFGSVLILCLFAFVTMHELGHSLVAKRYGIPVHSIVLTPIGGIAQLGRNPMKPSQEAVIAIAGPLVNVALALVIGGGALYYFGIDAIREGIVGDTLREPSLMTFWILMLAANVTMAVFNMIPAFPMDGGRVLRALLVSLVGARRGTEWAVNVGRVIAVAGIAFAFVYGALIVGLISVFILAAGSAELRAGAHDRVLKSVLARDAVNPLTPRFLPTTTVSDAARAVAYTHVPAFAVEHFGRLLGVVMRARLAEAAARKEFDGYVTGMMVRDVPIIAATATLADAQAAMATASLPFVAVADGETFIGILTVEDLAHQVAMESRGEPPTTRPATSTT